MAYQALYRRYRPAKFEDFVGQEAIIKTLSGQVMSGRIAHAYLFCGTRGTGKTSAAKVFARAINCETPVNGDPCGNCRTCRAMESESAMDILEIDAASNNGVDEIRDLRERVKYPPQIGRYKVYIIDEVHMLSTGAFNALLKTLEEPPEHAKFILATTEPQRLPATILSRCQRFDFGRIPTNLIAERLLRAMDEIGMKAEPEALARIARAAEGGMRDAWSITDMCMGYATENPDGLTDALVREVLGATDSEFLFGFMDAVLSTDGASVLRQIDEMMRHGQEVQVFLKDVTGHVRALLLAQICGQTTAQVLDIPEDMAARYQTQAGRVTRERLLQMMDVFLKAESDMKWSSQPRFILEATALRACQPEEKLQLEALVTRLGEVERKMREAPVVTAAPRSTTKTPPKAEEKPVVRKVDEEGEKLWQEIMQKVRQKKPGAYGLLRPARFHSATPELITAVMPQANAINIRMLNEGVPFHKDILDVIEEVTGGKHEFRVIPEDGRGSEEERRAAEAEIQKNISKIVNQFGRDAVSFVDEIPSGNG